MGISSSALASLVIAGTAIGGTTIAVIANTAQSDLKSSNISQISTETQTPLVPADKQSLVPTTLVPNRKAMPVNPTPDSSLPVITPPPFSVGGNDDDDGSEGSDDESEGSDDESYGGYDDGDSDHGDYGDEEDD